MLSTVLKKWKDFLDFVTPPMNLSEVKYLATLQMAFVPNFMLAADSNCYV